MAKGDAGLEWLQSGQNPFKLFSQYAEIVRPITIQNQQSTLAGQIMVTKNRHQLHRQGFRR